MKTLEHHTIYFDEACPLCRAYTHAFVRTGMLGSEGRCAYQQMSHDMASRIDTKRAVDEIALFDHQSGKVYYGVESLLRVIGHSYPFLKPLFALRPVAWIFRKLYKFVSFNRRVIIPADVPETASMKEPSFQLHYRIAYLLFTWIITAFILHRYSFLLAEFIPSSLFIRELFICGGQIVWQAVVMQVTDRRRIWDYLGNMMTVSFAGSLLLLPAIFLHSFANLPPGVYAVYFMMVAGFMFLEHIRRTKILQLGWVLTASWAFYRIVLLFILLQ